LAGRSSQEFFYAKGDNVKVVLCSFLLEILLVAVVGQVARGQSMPDGSMHDMASPGRAQSKTNSQASRITIKDFSFGPASTTVPTGTKVTWVNKDEEPHKVVSVDEIFKSTALDTDGEFSFVFSKPGTYKYFCSVHPRMVGTVVVEDSKPSGSMK
jgi:plastocyanin